MRVVCKVCGKNSKTYTEGPTHDSNSWICTKCYNDIVKKFEEDRSTLEDIITSLRSELYESTHDKGAFDFLNKGLFG